MEITSRHSRSAEVLFGLLVLCLPLTQVQASGWPEPDALAGGVRPPTQTGTSTPRFEPAACPVPIPAGEHIECGYLVVPEDRRQAGGAEIRLAVAILKSRSAHPAPDPVIFLAGGPGDGALDQLSSWRQTSLRETRDFILLDQRGAGYSQPSLQCPEVTSQDAQTQGQYLRPNERITLDVQAAVRCRDRLLGQGVHLAAYSSAASAADVDDLREALGYKEWNLYGTSYGTRLALTVLRDHPEGVRSVILDSVVPPQVHKFEQFASNVARGFGALFHDCEAAPDCHAAYPDLEHAFYEVVAGLDAHPITLAVPDLRNGGTLKQMVDGDDLVELVFQVLNHDRRPSFFPLLPLVITQVHAGNYGALANLLALFPRDDGPGVSLGLYYSIQCYEKAVFDDRGKVATSAAAYPALRSYLLARSDLAVLPVCDIWGAAKAPPLENEPVRSDIPALVLAGEYDPDTTPAWGRLAATTLSRSFHYEFPALGHGIGYAPDECPALIRNQFVSNPSAAPDASCITQMRAPAFVTGVYLNGGVARLVTSLYPKPDLLPAGIAASSLLLLLSALIGWPAGYLAARLIHRHGVPTLPRFARYARALAWLMAALSLAFVIALGSALGNVLATNVALLAFGLPSATAPLFVVPWLVAALAVGAAVCAGLAWWGRYWSVAGRIHYTLVALAGLCLAGLLLHWGLAAGLA